MSEIKDTYKTISAPSEGSYKEKGSKFFAFAYPVRNEEEIKERQKELRKKFYDARHHCYAFRLGAQLDVYRASDDGEPSNSSGPPILNQIRSYELTNILIVVVRYFGGIKLGIPGLINAYKTASADAIESTTIITKTEDAILDIYFGYPLMNEVMRLAKDDNIEQLEHKFEESCKLRVAIRKSLKEGLVNKLKLIHGVEVKDIN